MTLAIIGGSGIYTLEFLVDVTQQQVDTPYGATSAPLLSGKTTSGQPLFFLTRHGPNHSMAPHEINYRANIWALKEIGATDILAVNAVGGIGTQMAPTCLAVPSQLIDYSWGREHTFVGNGNAVDHIDFTHPYSQQLRQLLLDAAKDAAVEVVGDGTYACTQGPRLETAAEVRKLAADGCDLVGMTGMPEAALARELSLGYASLCCVVNWAAGLSDQELSWDVLSRTIEACANTSKKVLQTAAENYYSAT